jgi:hypothetical protein
MDTKGVDINRNSKDRQYNGQKFEDNKGVIRNRKLNNRQYKGYQRCRHKP